MQKKIVLFAAAISLLLGALHANNSFIYDDSEDQYMFISKCHPSKQGPQGPPGTFGGVTALGSYYCYSLNNAQKNVIVPNGDPVPFNFVASQMGGISCNTGFPAAPGVGVITITDPGTWLITYGASWDSNDNVSCSGGTSLRGCALFLNGSSTPIPGTAMFNQASLTDAVDTIFTNSTIIHLNANDKITVQPYDTGAACPTLQLDCNENQEGVSLDGSTPQTPFTGPFVIPVCHITLMKIAP